MPGLGLFSSSEAMSPQTASAVLQGLLPEEFHWHHHSQILFSFRISTHGAWGQKATGKVACVESMKA